MDQEMKENSSDATVGPSLTSNADQAQSAGPWRPLLVVSCSLPLHAHPSPGCSAHALCVSLLDELKEEVHVVVRHRVRLWRRVATPGTWCAVAGLLPAPFQHNARVWYTCVDSRVRPSTARELRAHLYPRAWQEQHSRTRAGLFHVVRRLRSGDLVLRAQTDSAEFVLVTYFASKVASFPPIPVGALVSLHGASCLDHQGVLAMCARTDLRVVDVDQATQMSAHQGNADDGWQALRHRTKGPKDSGREPCNIYLLRADQHKEGSFVGERLRTGPKLGSGDHQENLGESSYVEAVPNLFHSFAEDVLSSNPRTVESPFLGSVSERTETASQNNRRDTASDGRPSKNDRFFDDSPRLYKPPRKLRRMSIKKVDDKVPACGNVEASRTFPTHDLEDEDPGSHGACAIDVGARNLAQYLWYLEMVIMFRGRFGVALGSGCLELAVAKLLCFLNPTEDEQGYDKAVDACTSDSCHCLPDCVLSDCFSDDHACPLVAGGEATLSVLLSLQAAFEDTKNGLTHNEGSDQYEPASVSERQQNVVGIFELSPRGSWLFRQPRFDGSVLRKHSPCSAQIESASELYDSGFQSPEDSPAFIDTDSQSQQNSQTITDTDSQSHRPPCLFRYSFFPSQTSSCSFDSGFSGPDKPTLSSDAIDTDSQSQRPPCLFKYSFFPSQTSSHSFDSSFSGPDKPTLSSGAFVAVVMNADLDASMHGRLVLLSECRLVVERGTAHEMVAGIWIDSLPVQDLAHLRLPAPTLAPPPSAPSAGLCPLCANGPADVAHCDERWDPDIDAIVSDPGPWDLGPLDGVDPAFVALSLAMRHRFVLHGIGAPGFDDDGRHSCLLLISLLQSFTEPTSGRLAVFSLRDLQLRWLPLLRVRAGYTLRGCVRRVADVMGLPAFRTQSKHARVERHVCAHDWPAVMPEGMRSLDAVVVGVNAPHAGGPARGFADWAWLDVRDDADAIVKRLYLSGWGQREPPRALTRGTRLLVTCVQERTSAAGRAYLHPTPLTNIQVVSLVSAEPSWWAPALPPIGLPGVTAGMLPPRSIVWALAAARCPRCSVSKRKYVCDCCGLAGPGRTRVTLRLRAEQDVELIAVDNVAASVLGYSAHGWQSLIDQVAQVSGALEWAGPDDEVPEDRHSAPWVRRFYAACRTQPPTQLAVRCRSFKGRQDAADLRFVLEARYKSSESSLASISRGISV